MPLLKHLLRVTASGRKDIVGQQAEALLRQAFPPPGPKPHAPSKPR